MFLVTVKRSGPQWDPAKTLEQQSGWPAHATFVDGLVSAGFIVVGGPLLDEHRGVYVVAAQSEAIIRERLAKDAWNETHLRVDSIEPWTIRLDGRRR